MTTFFSGVYIDNQSILLYTSVYHDVQFRIISVDFSYLYAKSDGISCMLVTANKSVGFTFSSISFNICSSITTVLGSVRSKHRTTDLINMVVSYL